jgi:hypothetical protein
MIQMTRGHPTIESLLAFHQSEFAKAKTYRQGYGFPGGCKCSNPDYQ